MPHNLQDEKEKNRIIENGGFISSNNNSLRVNGELAVTRALGNSGPRPLISTNAEHIFIEPKELSAYKGLIMVTDGITGNLY